MLTRSRRALATAVVGGLAVLLAGCGTGFEAQTNSVYEASVGTDDRSSDVQVLNALFVKNDDGSGTLSAGLVNQTLKADRLVEVEVSTLDGTPVDVTFDGPVPVPARRLETLGTKPQVVIEGSELFAGQFLVITYTFANAGDVDMQLPIVTRIPMYDSVAEPGASTPTSPATPKASSAVDQDTPGEEDEGAGTD
ncbi:hypothetical protein KV097_14585 [Mumia sp. zg.B17]|uniref:hypothetical protein n=1 Tax=unclassified Mumia TaxID=2621872 RepID=UPI001C6E3F5D|nr:MULTISPECIES: hypothetical protein [unclassified Mumia]MBW9207170.1 hypothetical protein [Mumia sp. zg.B17]MDD9347636.1 hypothetical protein [Mumia sp.]